VIEILQRSLNEPYLINENKFDVGKLIKLDSKVNSVLLQEFEAKIQTKVNV